MISHVKVVGVCVSDQQLAQRFYVEKLGFELRRDDPMGPNARWIEVAPKGAQTSLVPFTPPGLENRIGSFANVVLACSDAQLAYRELSARGVEFVEPPTRQP